jgi:transposase
MRTSRRIEASDRERGQLQQVVRDGNTRQKVALRAHIVLLSVDGVSTGDIMRRLGTSAPTITRWRNRYEAEGIAGLLRDRSRPGRRRRIDGAKIAEVVERTLREKPPDATHWSTRRLAAVTGLSRASIQRIWKAHGLKPHQIRSFK